MAHDIPAAAISAANLISTTGAWLTFLDIAYPSTTASPRDHFRYVNNMENITAELPIPGDAAHTYYHKVFEVGQIQENIQGDVPGTTLVLADVDLTFSSVLQANDGFSGGEVIVQYAFVTPGTPPTVTDPEVAHRFIILGSAYDDATGTITFNLGASTPLNKRFPRDHYISTICRHRFRDGHCRFTQGILSTRRISFWAVGTLNGDYIRIWSYTGWFLFKEDQLIKTTGSVYNDGTYKIARVVYGEAAGYGRLYLDTTYHPIQQTENAAETLEIGIRTHCDKTLVQCRANDNSQQYGGSPGIAEGIYG